MVERVGEVIRRVRGTSQFRSLRAFGIEVGLSAEGLRRIERGIILPTDDTIWRILLVPGIPKEVGQQLLFLWEQERFQKSGRLPHSRARPSKSKVFRTTRRVVSHFMLYLHTCGLRVSLKDRKRLMLQTARLLEEEIYGDRSPLFAKEP